MSQTAFMINWHLSRLGGSEWDLLCCKIKQGKAYVKYIVKYLTQSRNVANGIFYSIMITIDNIITDVDSFL